MKLHVIPMANGDKRLYFAVSVRNGTKVSSRNVESIGLLSELKSKYADPVAHFREEARKRTLEGRGERSFALDPTKRLDPSERRKVMLGYLFPQRVYYGLGLDSAMSAVRAKSRAQFDFGRIVRDLVVGRILDPLSKQATFSLSDSFPERRDYDLHEVYRALLLLDRESDFVQARTYRGARAYADVDTSVVYYDCTNFFFETKEEDGFRTYGKSKENRPNPIVQMGLFIDSNGIPVSMCVNPGRTNEQVTMIPLEKKMREEFGIRKFVVCADCGLSGKKNLRYNSGSDDRGFVVTKSLKRAKEDVRAHLMAEGGWKRAGESGRSYTIGEIDSDPSLRDAVFFHDERFRDEDGFEERIVTTYSVRMRDYQRSVRADQIDRAMRLVSSGKSRLGKRAGENDPRRFVRETHATEDGEVCGRVLYEMDTDRIEAEMAYDGYYAVSTDLSDPAAEIIRINRGRWEVEETFRIMKTDFDARPVYLSREACIRAHFTVCFLAMVVFRVIEQKLLKAGEAWTSSEILEAIRGCNATDRGSFYSGEMEGRAIPALEKAFGLPCCFEAITKRNFQRLTARSKKTD